ncbi:hypothetical protein [Paraburkholderia sp. J8-2]|uniref:hypothetical protein n=1 Tax=Paraburkholderia sp. J8-2 TaxID=2805440 RepID=UPI002AB73F09|nr:hypothetical protein [Paraburkholderia sp. J8-2]
MQLHEIGNRDPRWSDEDNERIESKVDEAMAIVPRVRAVDEDGAPMSPEQRRLILLTTFREIVKATSLDNLMCAPAAMLEQFAVLALARNDSVMGELVQIIRVFMIAYSDPSTNEEACGLLRQLDVLARKALAAQQQPERFRWAALPGSDYAHSRMTH